MDPGLACFSVPHGLGPGGHWAWPNPSPSSFFGRRLRVRTPPAVSLLGVCSPQARRLGGTGERGLEPTLDHACWDARGPGTLMGLGGIYWGWSKGGIGGDKRGVGART